MSQEMARAEPGDSRYRLKPVNEHRTSDAQPGPSILAGKKRHKRCW